MLATWLTKKNIKFFAIPNGGHRHFLTAAKLKRCGVQSGVPDIFIPICRNNLSGLFLELKKIRGGIVSENQKSWLKFLNEAGYKAVVAYGFEHAKEIVLDYFSDKCNN